MRAATIRGERNYTTQKVQISRETAKAFGREMVEIIDPGRYVTSSGRLVEIRRERCGFRVRSDVRPECHRLRASL